MKQLITVLAFGIFVAACGGNADKAETSKDSTASTSTAPAAAPEDNLSTNPDYKKGLTLIAQNDCLTCHKVEEKLVGPAYREVAAKYENTPANVTMLAGKVIKGGSGNWGPTAMSPHSQLSQEDAEAMVKYILLLKK
jgi:cytochrome c